jgi:hydroxyacylglutathione hydrolase
MKLLPLRLSVTNDFILKAGDGYILVDTGYEVDWALFCKCLARLNIGLQQISHVVLTHHDDDHSGLLTRIAAKSPATKIVMSHLAKELLAAGRNDTAHGRHFVNKRVALLMALQAKYLKILISTGRWIRKKDRLAFPPYHVRPGDVLIEKDIRLKDIGIDLDGWILATPGHTIDSISTVFDDGDALVGDAAANMIQWAGTKYCVIALDDIGEYYRSWQKLITANAQRIFPAHGKPFSVSELQRNIWKNV